MLLTMDRSFWACVFDALIIAFNYEDPIVV